MSLRQSIRDKIAAITAVEEHCGDRVFWVRPTKQDQLPCVVFDVTQGKRSVIDSCGPSGHSEATIAITVLSRDAEQAIEIIEAIIADEPGGLHDAKWTGSGAQITSCEVTEFGGDDWMEAPFSAFMTGCAVDLKYI